MKKDKRLILCVCIPMLLCSCGSILSDYNVDGEKTKNEIVSGIENKIGDVAADFSLTYWGESNALKEYSEKLKSDKISPEMKNSRFFRAISSVVWGNCVCIETGFSFTEQDASYSFNYIAGFYNVRMDETDQSGIPETIVDSQKKMTYYINASTKEYCTEKATNTVVNEFDSMLGSYLDVYDVLAVNGKITGSGKETVFGKEMEYEDISLMDETSRFYYDTDNTLFLINTESGSYHKLANYSNANTYVPFGYKEVSMERFVYDGLENNGQTR